MQRSTPLIFLLCASLSGCAAAREARQEKRDIRQEADAQQADLDSTSRDDALLAIAQARQSRSGVDILRRYANHAEPRARREALRALGLVGDPSTQGTLEGALQDPDATVRSAAAFALSQLWSWPLAPLERVSMEITAEVALDAALADEVTALRRSRGSLDAAGSMARALGEIGDDATADSLWTLAGDVALEPSLRREAWFALGMRGKRGHTVPGARLPELTAGLAGETAFPAAWALARSPVDADVATALGPLLRAAFAEAEALAAAGDAGADDAAAWILRALGRSPGPDADALWAEQGASPHPRRRLNVVRGAALAKVAPPLLAAATDADLQVAAEALVALGSLTDAASWAALQPREGLDPALEAARLTGLTGRIIAPAAAADDDAPSDDTKPNDDAPADRIDHADRDATLLAAGLAALEHAEPRVRAAAAGLLSAHPAPAAADALLARVPLEEDAVVALALASAVAARPDGAVEGQLLTWLAAEDPTLGAIAAEGLTSRMDDHITVALLASWRAHPGPADWERRVAILRAVAERSTVPPDYYGEALGDADPHVRLAAFFALSQKAGRSQAGTPPLARELAPLADAWFGVADVERATITTSRGEMTLLLYPRSAPAAVANFTALADRGYFDGQLVHRVVPDFVVQSGDPTNTGWGGPGWTLPDEFGPLEYRRGTLGMARSDKDTAGSQWFITHSPQPHLTGHYTAFGQLMTGWDVLDQLRVGDRIERVVVQRKNP